MKKEHEHKPKKGKPVQTFDDPDTPPGDDSGACTGEKPNCGAGKGKADVGS